MAADEVNEATEKKGPPTMIIIIAVAVLVGAGGFFAGKMLSGGGEDPSKDKAAAKVETKPAEDGGDEQSAEETKEPETEAPAEESADTPPPAEGEDGAAATPVIKGNPLGEGLLMLDEFTVNLNDPFGRRFGKFNIKLVIKPKKHIPKLKADELLMSKIRDEIIMIISAKSYNELKGTSGRVTLKEEIVMRTNEKIADKMAMEPVISVLFTEFLIQ